MNEAYRSCFEVSAIALLASICSLPFWRAACRGSGLIDTPGHRKVHDKPIPLAGGLAVSTGIATAIGWVILTASQMGHSPSAVTDRIWGLAGGSMAMLLLGLLDDRFELRAGVKLVGQLVIASFACYAGLRLHLFPGGLDLLASVLWIIAVTNAFNFMDNMNGLSAGLACIGSFATGIILWMCGDSLGTLLCLTITGATMGFLPFNYPRASAFLGDSGSHLLGFLMAAVPLNAGLFGSSASAKAVPILLVFVPLLDLIQVVAWRIWQRRAVWIGDRNHLSHRLVDIGMKPPIAVALLWGIAAAAAFAGVCLWRR